LKTRGELLALADLAIEKSRLAKEAQVATSYSSLATSCVMLAKEMREGENAPTCADVSQHIRLVPNGIPVPLCELEGGSLFAHGSTVAVKSEYRHRSGAINAVIVGSGEYFLGGADNDAEQQRVMVQPLAVVRSR
jgi:hypothetical protein